MNDPELWKSRLTLYDELIDLVPNVERKGKTMPYTSTNGYMFSMLNKAGEIGIRLPKAAREQFVKEHEGSGPFISYGAKIREYVLIPENMLGDLEALAHYLVQSFEYTSSLPPK